MLTANQIFDDMSYASSYFMTLVDNKPLQIEPIGFVTRANGTPFGFIWRLHNEQGEQEIFAYLDNGVPDLETLSYLHEGRRGTRLAEIELLLNQGRNDRSLQEAQALLRSVCTNQTHSSAA